MANDTMIQDMLKDIMQALRKADPDAAAAFKKKHKGFGQKLAEAQKTATTAAKAASASTPSAPKAAEPKPEEWKPVKSKKEKSGAQAGPTSAIAQDRDVLENGGWSKPVLNVLGAVRPDSEGVFLATSAEAKQLVAEVRAQGSLAILSPIEFGDTVQGAWTSVLVKDKNGRQQVRRRWLVQLGTSPVLYTPDAPKAAAIVADTKQVVLTLSESHCSRDSWKAAQAAPREAASRWLRFCAKADILDIRPPTRVAGRAGEIQVVASVSVSTGTATLRSSGKHGVWTRPFYQKPEDRERFGVVQMEASKNLDESCRAAERLGENAWGVVPTRNGFAIRVLATAREEAVKLLRPDGYNLQLGTLYEVSGLPQNMGKEALAAFLGNWPMQPIRSWMAWRPWLVRAQIPPVENLRQYDDGLAVIKAAAPRTVTSRPVERWSPLTTRPNIEWPTAWRTPAEMQTP